MASTIIHYVMANKLASELCGIDSERFQAIYENLQKYFDSKPCEKSELELYTWDDVTEYMEKSVRICISEYDAMTKKKERILPSEFFLGI